MCLGKIAQYLDPKNRSKILSSAFGRALKDPFPPSRIAGKLDDIPAIYIIIFYIIYRNLKKTSFEHMNYFFFD